MCGSNTQLFWGHLRSGKIRLPTEKHTYHPSFYFFVRILSYENLNVYEKEWMDYTGIPWQWRFSVCKVHCHICKQWTLHINMWLTSHVINRFLRGILPNKWITLMLVLAVTVSKSVLRNFRKMTEGMRETEASIWDSVGHSDYFIWSLCYIHFMEETKMQRSELSCPKLLGR